MHIHINKYIDVNMYIRMYTYIHTYIYIYIYIYIYTYGSRFTLHKKLFYATLTPDFSQGLLFCLPCSGKKGKLMLFDER